MEISAKSLMDKLVSNLTSAKQPEQDYIDKQGRALFELEDLKTTSHPLTQMMRYFIMKNRVTNQYFDMLHIKACSNANISVNHIGCGRNNIKRTMKQEKVTWDFFEKVINICGFDIMNITLELKNQETEETQFLSYGDVVNAMGDDIFPDNLNVAGSRAVTCVR